MTPSVRPVYVTDGILMATFVLNSDSRSTVAPNFSNIIRFQAPFPQGDSEYVFLDFPRDSGGLNPLFIWGPISTSIKILRSRAAGRFAYRLGRLHWVRDQLGRCTISMVTSSSLEISSGVNPRASWNEYVLPY